MKLHNLLSNNASSCLCLSVIKKYQIMRYMQEIGSFIAFLLSRYVYMVPDFSSIIVLIEMCYKQGFLVQCFHLQRSSSGWKENVKLKEHNSTYHNPWLLIAIFILMTAIVLIIKVQKKLRLLRTGTALIYNFSVFKNFQVPFTKLWNSKI